MLRIAVDSKDRWPGTSIKRFSLLAALSLPALAAACASPTAFVAPTTSSPGTTDGATREVNVPTPAIATPAPPVAVRPTAQATTPALAPVDIPGGVFGDGVRASTLVPTSAWKTYVNATYGFTFAYPSDWQFAESDSSGLHGPNGEPAYPRHSVTVQNPPNEQGAKVPGVNCSVTDNDCIGANPLLLAFSVSINRPGSCDFTGAISSDTTTIANETVARCASEFPNDHSRGASIELPLASGDVIDIQLAKGNEVQPPSQAVLDTILASFHLVAAAGGAP